ncbi:ribosome recycling factor [Candidatus Peregrinibacteria bacterium]|nr:MAG: ribosome recycling factor [Candidatus Peregrinibacteria bacterium]
MHILLSSVQEEFHKAVSFLKKEYASLQTGRANSGLVEDIEVEQYGQRMPIRHLANISLNGQEILIDPWDRSVLSVIEKAIREKSDLGLNPINNGVAIRINVPPLTEDRRREMVKIVHQKAEHARVSIRQARQGVQEKLRKEEKDGGMSEDDLKRLEKDLQKEVDEANKKVEDLCKHKEIEVMTV